MTLSLAEGLVDAIITYFDSNVAAKVADLNAEYMDDITLVVPAEIYNSEKSLEHIPQYPAFFVLVTGTRISDWRQSVLEATHDVTIGVMVLEQDEAVIRRTLYRYMRAIIELLIESQVAAALGWILDVDVLSPGAFSISFNPIYTSNDQYLADAQLATTFVKSSMETL